MPHTYLTAFGLRHLSPEEHAAGRVLNSHKRQRKRAHTWEKWRGRESSVRHPPDFQPPRVTIQVFLLTSKQLCSLGIRRLRKDKTTRGPKSITANAAIKCGGFHGAKVCSPPACFLGEHQRQLRDCNVRGSALSHDPTGWESQNIAALKAADCHDYTVLVPGSLSPPPPQRCF